MSLAKARFCIFRKPGSQWLFQGRTGFLEPEQHRQAHTGKVERLKLKPASKRLSYRVWYRFHCLACLTERPEFSKFNELQAALGHIIE